jgi:hypothetical protein
MLPILPQADAACGKIFFADRRTADGHRIALEVWNRATGRVREGYRLAVYRCKRCGGYHLGYRPVDRILSHPLPETREDLDRKEEHDREEQQPVYEWGFEAPRARKVALSGSAWW